MAANISEIRSSIESALGNVPNVFRRSKIRQEIDGCSPGVMSNFDNAGTGPKDRVMIGRKTAYPKKSYVDWAVSRITPVPEKEVIHENQTANS